MKGHSAVKRDLNLVLRKQGRTGEERKSDPLDTKEIKIKRI